jgi:hypothetical protein
MSDLLQFFRFLRWYCVPAAVVAPLPGAGKAARGAARSAQN